MTTFANLAFLDRPSGESLVWAAICIVLGWLAMWATWWVSIPTTIEPGPPRKPNVDGDGDLETPALVALLTNGFQVPATAITATVLDLASRGWVKLTSTEGELVVVTSGKPSSDDVLSAYEQQVINHLASRAFNDYTSAGTLAVSQSDINLRWRWRFNRSVVAASQQRGLTTDRYKWPMLLVPAALVAIALLVLTTAAFRGTPVAVQESWRARGLWAVLLIAAIVLARAVAGRFADAAQVPTEAGVARAKAWMGYRQVLASRIPAGASVIGNAKQQWALANATVTGVAGHVLRQVPVVRADSGRGWSEAGGTAHVVSIRYPIRPGYGQHPARVAAVGIVGFILGSWVRGFLRAVADGTRLGSWIDDLPTGGSVVTTIADIISLALLVPIIGFVWCIGAGLIDTLVARRRVGVVVRSRPPQEILNRWFTRLVRPFGDRGGFLTYLAIDDGNRAVVTAALATDRTAAPQGAQVRALVTPLLGYVHSTEPVGTAGVVESPAVPAT